MPTPNHILFAEVYRQVNPKFHDTALFYEKLESRKEKIVYFAFVPDGFSYLIMAISRLNDQTSLGRVEYEIRKFSPCIDSQRPGGHLELEISQAVKSAQRVTTNFDPYSLDAAFIACVQCEMALRMEKSDE